MEAKHPVDALLQTARTAFGALTGALTGTIDQHVLSPAGDRTETFLNRVQLVPKPEFDRLKSELETMQQQVARLEQQLAVLVESNKAGR